MTFSVCAPSTLSESVYQYQAFEIPNHCKFDFILKNSTEILKLFILHSCYISSYLQIFWASDWKINIFMDWSSFNVSLLRILIVYKFVYYLNDQCPRSIQFGWCKFPAGLDSSVYGLFSTWSGNLTNSADHPAFPADPSTAGPDIASPSILRNPTRSRTAEQVRITWTLSTGPSTRS